MNEKNSLDELLNIMTRLRDDKKGCPWDKIQTEISISKYTLEEAYEVYEAVHQQNPLALKEELGDLLFHIVFYAQIAQEKKEFSFFDVAKTACDKMIRRHPHIFCEDKNLAAPDWETLKEQERKEKQQSQQTSLPSQTSVLSGIAKALPATVRAYKLQNRAARVGFDWNEPHLVLDKIIEEALELKEEIKKAHLQQANYTPEQEEEMGDLLFACINLSRKLGIDPEEALKKTNKKFQSRFEYIEKKLLEQNKPFSQTTLDEMEHFWIEAKIKQKSEKKEN